MFKVFLIIIFIIILVWIIFLIYKKSFIQEQFQNNSIPKIIYQTYLSRDIIPDKVFTNIKKFAPSYKHIIYDDNDCLHFIKKHYSNEILDAYYKLINKAHRADLFRYCLLYKKGGIYLDIKTELIKPINKIFTHNYFYSVLSKVPSTIYQGIIATPSFNPIFLQLIEYIVNNYQKINKSYLSITYDMYHKINRLTTGNQVKQGLNKSNNNKHVDFYLFTENCNQNSNRCPDGLDRYGFCCYVYDNNNPIIKTRYADYPW